MAIESSIKYITPDIARLLLKNNATNRAVRKNRVQSYANLMRNGYFQTTHQGIAISETGKLLDGQHRLLACIQVNKPIAIMVTTGLNEDVFKNIDCGAMRSISDRTKLDKKKAEATRYLLRLALTEEAGRSPDLNLQLSNSGFGEIHDQLTNFCKGNKKIFSSAQVRTAACTLVMNGHDKNYIFNVYKDLINMNIEYLPAIALSFFKQFIEKKHTGFTTEIFCKAVKVFDIKNKDIQRLVCTENEEKEILSLTSNFIHKIIYSKD